MLIASEPLVYGLAGLSFEPVGIPAFRLAFKLIVFAIILRLCRKQRPIGRFLFQQFLFFLSKHFFCISKPFFYFGLFFCIHNAIHFLLNSENFVKENLMWLGFSYTCLAEFLSTVALEMMDTPQMDCFWKLCFPATEWLFFSVCDETFCCS